MNKSRLGRRLEKLEAKVVALRFGCVCVDDIERAARGNMRPTDLQTLEQAMTCEPQDFTSAQRAVWNRWEKLRAEAIEEASGGANVVILLSTDDSRL
jgi:hypothetical protein